MVMTIGDKLARIRTTKKSIRDAVNQKGGYISADTPFEEYPDAIDTIPQAAGGSGIPPGAIIAWYGDAENVPTGWALCDGENGTPDLRGRFVLGVSDAYSVGSEGGEAAVTLTVEEIPSHSHMLNMADAIGTMGNRSVMGVPSISKTAYTALEGGSRPHNNMPPYYTLYYIMKLPDEVVGL